MQEMIDSNPEPQSLSLEESSAISDFERDATSIFPRRIQTGSRVLQKVVPNIGRHLAWETQADYRHAYLNIFPKHEKSAVIERRKKFGTPFPGLYSLGGKSVGLIKAVGGIEVNQQKHPAMILGRVPGHGTITGRCAFNIDRNVRLTICNMRIKSAKNDQWRYDYQIFLMFLVTFGDTLHPFDVSSILEDQVVLFFREASSMKIAA